MTGNRRFLFVGLVLSVVLGFLAGCADLEKKVIRKKKEPERPRLFLEPASLSNEELYRQHYTFWKGWHTELIRDLGGNHKKEIQDVVESQRHLRTLSRYLKEERGRELDLYLGKFDSMTAPLLQGRLSATDNAYLSHRLDALKVRIENRFSPKRVSAYLKPTPPPMDLSLYEDTEEVPLPSSLGGIQAPLK